MKKVILSLVLLFTISSQAETISVSHFMVSLMGKMTVGYTEKFLFGPMRTMVDGIPQDSNHMVAIYCDYNSKLSLKGLVGQDNYFEALVILPDQAGNLRLDTSALQITLATINDPRPPYKPLSEQDSNDVCSQERGDFEFALNADGRLELLSRSAPTKAEVLNFPYSKKF